MTTQTDMHTLKLTNDQTRVVLDALSSYRNKLVRESKYDGVGRTRRERMLREAGKAVQVRELITK